jgi:hypothetical protein
MAASVAEANIPLIEKATEHYRLSSSDYIIMCLVFIGSYILARVMEYLGFYSFFLVVAVIVLVVPLILVKVFHVNIPWLPFKFE